MEWDDFKIYLQAERGLGAQAADKTIQMLRLFEKVDYPHSLSCFDLQGLQQGLLGAEKRYPSSSSMNLLRNALRHWIRYIFEIDSFDSAPILAPRTLLQRVIGWVRGEKHSELDMQTLSRVKRILKSKKVQPRKPSDREERVSLEKILNLILTSRSQRWKALLAFWWDVAFRPGEISSLNYDHIGCNSETWYVDLVREKSKKAERHNLMTWVSHMFFIPYYTSLKPSSDPLFPTRDGERMSSDSIGQNLYDRSKRSGVKVYGYGIRKGGSTWWERRGVLPVSSIRSRLGHKENSRVFETNYLCVFAEDYDDDVSRAQGRFIPDVEPYIQRFCIFCSTINPPKDEPLYRILMKKGLAHSRDHCFRCGSKLIVEDEDVTVAPSYERPVPSV